MPSVWCPACNTNLDAVAVGDQCPGCGGRGLFVVVSGFLAATPTISASVLVREALAELAALPADAALVLPSGADLRVGGGRPIVDVIPADGAKAATVAHASVVVVGEQTPALRRVLENEDVRRYLVTVAGGLTVAVLTRWLLTTQPPTVNVTAYCPPAAAQVEPAPAAAASPLVALPAPEPTTSGAAPPLLVRPKDGPGPARAAGGDGTRAK